MSFRARDLRNQAALLALGWHVSRQTVVHASLRRIVFFTDRGIHPAREARCPSAASDESI